MLFLQGVQELRELRPANKDLPGTDQSAAIPENDPILRFTLAGRHGQQFRNHIRIGPPPGQLVRLLLIHQRLQRR